MSSMKYSQLLAKVNFPLYTVQCLSDKFILVAGGGGSAKTGIRNAIEIYQLTNDVKNCRVERITHYETGSEAVMSSTAFDAGRNYILFTGEGGNCQVYVVEQKADEGNKDFVRNLDRKTASLRRRKNNTVSGSPTSKVRNEESDAKDLKLYFEIKPLDSFQTDFSEEPFQKLVKFSSLRNLLGTGGSDGHIRLWEHPKHNQIIDIEAHKDDVIDMDFCPSGKMIVSVSRDGHGRVWNTQDGSLITELIKSDKSLIFRSCRFGIVGYEKDLVLFTTLNPATRKTPPLKCYLCKYEVRNFILVQTVSTGTDFPSAMAISDDGRFVGLGCQSGSIKVYIAFSLQLLYDVRNIHGIFITSVQFLPTTDKSLQISSGHVPSLISVSVDNRIIIHHIPMKSSMTLLTPITLYIFTLFLIYVITDFFSLI